jgi:hypothetical protein
MKKKNSVRRANFRSYSILLLLLTGKLGKALNMLYLRQMCILHRHFGK